MLIYFPTCMFGQWTQLGSDIEGTSTNLYSGRSVAMSDDGQIFAVGTPSNEGVTSFRGYVDVYQLVNGVRQPMGQRIHGQGSSDHAGHEISMSANGQTLAIASPYNNDVGADAGQVQVYQYDSTSSTWLQKGSDLEGVAAGDEFGSAVSINASGDIVAVGAMRSDANGLNSGQVKVFSFQNGDWVQLGQSISGAAAAYELGLSVALNDAGSRLAIGGRLADGNGTNAGEVIVFDNINGSWTQVGQTITGDVAGDYMGNEVDLNADGSILAVGAPLNDANGSDAGVVKVFQFKVTTWVPMGQSLLGVNAGDKNGSSVSLTADGLMVAIGAIDNDGGGVNSGHVRVFRYNCITTTWNQVDQTILGESANSLSGFATCISVDGEYLLIGSPYNDDHGIQSGQTRLMVNNSVAAGPDLSTTQSADTLVAGQADAASYQWIDCNAGPIAGATDPVFTPTSNGSYAVIISMNGCGDADTSACHSFIFSSTQQNELFANDLSIFPNPSTGRVTIKTPNIEGIRVYNNLGQLVLERNYQNENQVELDLQQLPTAIYLLEVNSPLGRQTRKIVLNRP